MSDKVIGNYLRIHRRKFGLSQRELGRLIGYRNEFPVSRHERNLSVPPLLVALAYEIVFQVPVAAIFAGFQTTVAAMVATNLEEFTNRLQSTSTNRRVSKETMLKLQWLAERQKTQQSPE